MFCIVLIVAASIGAFLAASYMMSPIYLRFVLISVGIGSILNEFGLKLLCCIPIWALALKY